MAPKAPAKGPSKAPPGNLVEPEPTILNRLVMSSRVRNAAMIATVLLVSVALLIFSMYRTEEDKTMQLTGAIASMRGVLTYHNETYEKLNDIQTLYKIRKVVIDMEVVVRMNEKVMDGIDTVSELLYGGWKAKKGNLYYTNDESRKNHNTAIMDCERRKSFLVYITSSEEQAALENIAKTTGKKYWIGLYKVDDYWIWVTGERLKNSYSFWAPGNPIKQPTSEKRCAEVRACSSPLKCWFDVPCNEINNWICKMPSDPELRKP